MIYRSYLRLSVDEWYLERAIATLKKHAAGFRGHQIELNVEKNGNGQRPVVTSLQQKETLIAFTWRISWIRRNCLGTSWIPKCSKYSNISLLHVQRLFRSIFGSKLSSDPMENKNILKPGTRSCFEPADSQIISDHANTSQYMTKEHRWGKSTFTRLKPHKYTCSRAGWHMPHACSFLPSKDCQSKSNSHGKPARKACGQTISFKDLSKWIAYKNLKMHIGAVLILTVFRSCSKDLFIPFRSNTVLCDVLAETFDFQHGHNLVYWWHREKFRNHEQHQHLVEGPRPRFVQEHCQSLCFFNQLLFLYQTYETVLDIILFDWLEIIPNQTFHLFFTIYGAHVLNSASRQVCSPAIHWTILKGRALSYPSPVHFGTWRLKYLSIPFCHVQDHTGSNY